MWDDSVSAQQVGALSDLEGVEAVDRAGSTLRLSVDRSEARIPEIVLAASRAGLLIRSVTMHEPTLEDVFLKFTGKKIREAESAGAGRMVAVQSRMRTRRH